MRPDLRNDQRTRVTPSHHLICTDSQGATLRVCSSATSTKVAVRLSASAPLPASTLCTVHSTLRPNPCVGNGPRLPVQARDAITACLEHRIIGVELLKAALTELWENDRDACLARQKRALSTNEAESRGPGHTNGLTRHIPPRIGLLPSKIAFLLTNKKGLCPASSQAVTCAPRK